MAKIAVVGDVILDRYDWCRNKENPESSAPCYEWIRTEYRPGGAGNVAANLASLGCDVVLLGIRGQDEDGHMLDTVLLEKGIRHILPICKKRPTIVKTRVMGESDGRYHCRLDYEKRQPIETNHVEELSSGATGVDAIIVSDYRKGVVGSALMDRLRSMKIPIFVNGKPDNAALYHDVTLLTFNKKEAFAACGQSQSIDVAGRDLASRLHTSVLITVGDQGMRLYDKTGLVVSLDAHQQEVRDVTGAGDSVIATLAHFSAKGIPLREAMQYANIAGAISVRHVGCYHVKESDIFAFERTLKSR